MNSLFIISIVSFYNFENVINPFSNCFSKNSLIELLFEKHIAKITKLQHYNIQNKHNKYYVNIAKMFTCIISDSKRFLRAVEEKFSIIHNCLEK